MLVDINKIQVKDRIRKDFGDLQELADDIRDNGLINPPVVTPDTYELIAGERRLRAMELLNYKQIEVRPMAIKDAEHALNLEISENETRKDFSKAERIDYARRLERVESLKAKERMSIAGKGSQNSDTLRTDDFVAEKLGIGSRDTFRKEKFIVENQSSLSEKDFADWDEGKLSTNKAFQKIKQEKTALEQKVKELESRKPETVEVIKNQVIDNTDYDFISKLKEKNKTLESQKSILERKLKLYQEDSDKYNKLKADIDFLTKTKTDISRQIESATELSGLTVRLQNVLEKDLAPIKFKRCMETLDSSDVCVSNVMEIIENIESWITEMKRIIENRHSDIIDME